MKNGERKMENEKTIQNLKSKIKLGFRVESRK